MRKKGLFCLLAFLLLFAAGTFSVRAAGTYTESGGVDVSDYSNAVKCHTMSNGDGTVTVLYSVWDGAKLSLHVDRFSASGTRLSHKSVPVPGRSWGGTVYHGPDGCYYTVSGNSSDMAFYISKYSASWSLLGTASVSKADSYTSLAFNAGNSDMTMVGDYLIVHAARGRLDGHQSNETIYVNKNTMRAEYVTSLIGFNHVSHSFSQFVRNIGNQVLMVDHGDAYPRSVVLQTYQLNPGEFSSRPESYRKKTLLDIKGATGDNNTGVTVDGFELGRNNHLVVGTAIPHDRFASDYDFSDYEGGNNVYVILLDKSLQTSQLKWLTSYRNVQVKNLECVKINDHQFFLLYGTVDSKGNQNTCYMIIDSSGNVQRSGSIPKTFYCTSEASVSGNVVTWCHYVESKLGHFLVMNRWNVANGSFTVTNLDTGTASSISRIDGKKKYTITSRKETSVLRSVYSDGLNDGPAILPAVWTSSNPKVLEIVDEETMAGSRVYTLGEKCQAVSARVRAKKSGTVKVTCRIGDKKSTFKVKVKVKDKEKKPAKTKITGLKRKGKKALKVVWKKKKNISGYQISYAYNKKFRGAKKVVVKKAAVTSKTIKKLKRKKLCFVRIRTYKNVKSGNKTTKMYSKWSPVKKIRMK